MTDFDRAALETARFPVRMRLNLSSLFPGRRQIRVKEAYAAIEALLTTRFADASRSDTWLYRHFAKTLNTAEVGKRRGMKTEEIQRIEDGFVSTELEIECDFSAGTGYCEPCGSYCCCFGWNDSNGYYHEECGCMDE